MDRPVLDSAAIDRLSRLGGDTLVRQMIELFLEYGPGRIAALVEGGAAGDPVRVERAAHTLKSTAGNLGAARLQEAATTVEVLAGDGRIDAMLVDRVRHEYERLVDELHRRLQELTP